MGKPPFLMIFHLKMDECRMIGYFICNLLTSPLVSDDDGKNVFRGVATTKENVMSMWFKDAGIELDKPNYCGSISRQMLKNEGLRSETTDQSASTFRFPTEYV